MCRVYRYSPFLFWFSVVLQLSSVMQFHRWKDANRRGRERHSRGIERLSLFHCGTHLQAGVWCLSSPLVHFHHAECECHDLLPEVTAILMTHYCIVRCVYLQAEWPYSRVLAVLYMVQQLGLDSLPMDIMNWHLGLSLTCKLEPALYIPESVL